MQIILLLFFILVGIPRYGSLNETSVDCAAHTCQEKYYLAICAIFRDEERFLREWIEFHLCNGFEHFFLLSDRPSNLSCTNSLLQPYIDSGHVTLDQGIPVPDPQIPTYNACLHRYGALASWIAFIDIDEFLFPTNVSELVMYPPLRPAPCQSSRF